VKGERYVIVGHRSLVGVNNM